MPELSEMMRNPEYIRLYTAIESSGPQRGIIHIEDATDRLFWTKIVNAVCPGRYDIKPYSQPGSEGKRKLEQEYQQLSKEYLVAVDGDYDYLCPDRNEYAAALNANPFVLHTFCYSRESFLHTPEAIESLTDCIYLHKKTNCHTLEALQRFSVKVYDALLVFSWLHNRDQHRFKESDFNESFRLPAGVLLLDDNLAVNEAAFESLSRSVQQYTDTHASFISDRESFAQHQEVLRARGITPENALLFINGHRLLDGVFRPVYEKLIRKSRSIDNEWVETHYPENEKQDRKNQVKNHYKENCNARQLLSRCEAYTTSPFWQRITQKLSEAERTG